MASGAAAALAQQSIGNPRNRCSCLTHQLAALALSLPFRFSKVLKCLSKHVMSCPARSTGVNPISRVVCIDCCTVPSKDTVGPQRACFVLCRAGATMSINDLPDSALELIAQYVTCFPQRCAPLQPWRAKALPSGAV